MAAVKIKARTFPVTPRKRYRLLVEWIASDTSNAFTVEIEWFDEAEASLSTTTVFSKVATTANVWQVDHSCVVVPGAARYAHITCARGNNATQIGIARVEMRESESSLARKMNEIVLFDDFPGAGITTEIGSLPWAKAGLGGAEVTLSKPNTASVASTWSEFGVVRLTTPGTTGQGGLIHLNKLTQGPPPLGTEFRCKVLMQNIVNLRAWIGLWDSVTTSPDEALANTIRGIGFRLEPAGSGENWVGIVRNGTVESTTNLGVSGAAWRDLGWYMPDATSVRFLVNGVAAGSALNTNLPASTAELAPVIGLVTTANSAKAMDVDMMGLQTYLNRI